MGVPYVDVVFSGLSVASLAGALHLTERGFRVVVVEALGEVALRGMYAVAPFDVQTRSSGSAFEDGCVEIIRKRGSVVLYDSAAHALEGRHCRTTTARGDIIESRVLVYAPSGLRDNPPRQWNLDPYYGRTVSMCAWSDAPFWEGRDAVVLGRGGFPIDQALICAKIGIKVSLLAPEILAPSYLAPDLRDASRIRPFPGAVITRVTATEAGVDVDFHTPRGGDQVVPADVLFFSYLTGTYEELHQHARACPGRVFICGVPNGIDLLDTRAQYQDGIRLATELLSVLAPRQV